MEALVPPPPFHPPNLGIENGRKNGEVGCPESRSPHLPIFGRKILIEWGQREDIHGERVETNYFLWEKGRTKLRF
jgi:hypothetical protein